MKLAALILALSIPAIAGDSSTDKPGLNASLVNVRCVDGPKPGCVTCANVKTEQFQIVCGLSPNEQPKKGKKK